MRIGLIVNPIAGMGGPLGFKGTDNDTYLAAVKLGATRTSPVAAKRAISSIRNDIRFVSVKGMGSEVLDDLGIPHEIITVADGNTSAADTKAAAKLMERTCDLILFCGGDGTARDVLDAVGKNIPVLGIPAGVKMHSAVFATTPEDVSEIVHMFVDGYAKINDREVMDIDEKSLADGYLSAKLYGYMNVPYAPALVQASKGVYGGADEEAETDEVAEYVISEMRDDTLYLIGPGGTACRITEILDLDHTVLGTDAIFNGKVIGKDLNEAALKETIGKYERTVLILGIIGKQGFFIGRGNKEISPAVIRMIGPDNIILVSTRAKLNDLDELHADTGDPELDKELKGYRRVTCGYARERVMKVD